MINFDFAASSDYIGAIFDPVTFASRGFSLPWTAKARPWRKLYFAVGKRNRSLRFFGYVDNLFDREYFESGFRTPGVTGRAGAMFVF